MAAEHARTANEAETAKARKENTVHPGDRVYPQDTGYESAPTPKGSTNSNASSGSGARLLDGDGRKGGKLDEEGEQPS